MLQSGTTFLDLIFMSARAQPEPETHMPEEARASSHTHTRALARSRAHPRGPGPDRSELPRAPTAWRALPGPGGRSKERSSLASCLEYHLHFMHFMSKRSLLSPPVSPGSLEAQGLQLSPFPRDPALPFSPSCGHGPPPPWKGLASPTLLARSKACAKSHYLIYYLQQPTEYHVSTSGKPRHGASRSPVTEQEPERRVNWNHAGWTPKA